MRKFARLTAQAIEVSIEVITKPATWAANGLRRYADQQDEPPGRVSGGQDVGAPVAGE